MKSLSEPADTQPSLDLGSFRRVVDTAIWPKLAPAITGGIYSLGLELHPIGVVTICSQLEHHAPTAIGTFNDFIHERAG